jgi:hypothetical protein
MSRSQFRDVDPPFRVAWNQAVAGIRVRIVRQIVTVIGIALGIAFFCSLQVVRASHVPGDLRNPSQEAWLIGTSLLMCLVGITNSMLMSVSERYREIGTIKCLGASDGFIVKVFFLEAVMLGLCGSLSGALLGSGASWLVAHFQGGSARAADCLAIALTGTGIGMAMTVTSAIAPAIQAARMPAAAALRVEV